ncbi:hypothetical protein [Anaerococcus lactolyticus]|uniref:Uncharacterized protein n=1 Tax=Anaerococcus lactolyticus S7-1-13 TaxID=1284686 RepID=A0A095X121_9FIRM|nr:hypothetical protein [Anaerococcus lactolyticus]KGF03411.1 hypothetical protein HMPREF1630_07470 [Anaerococcus lactolyticus S7-1-13]
MKIIERNKKSFIGLITIGIIIGVAYVITFILSKEPDNFCKLLLAAVIWFFAIIGISYLIKKLNIYTENEYDIFNDLADIISSGIALFTMLIASFSGKEIDKQGTFLITIVCLSVLKLSVSILNFQKNNNKMRSEK